MHAGRIGSMLARAGGRAQRRGLATKVDMAALKRLRQLNAVPLTKAREALARAGNDVERALAQLERDALAAGAQKAAKVRDRVAAEGAVAVYAHGGRAAMVELGCETDFVARNATFVGLATRVAAAAAGLGAAGAVAEVRVDELADARVDELANARVGGRRVDGLRVGDAVTDAIGRLGENMVLRRAAAAGGAGTVAGAYVHGGGGGAGRIGALVALRSDGDAAALGELARQLAQHVVGFAPRHATRADAPDAAPDTVLETQAFVFGGGSVGDVLAQRAAALGAAVHVAGFVRFERGEGVARPAQPDFAAEVRRQLQ
ncbi:Elongation factor Ts, mitochondrial [Coemansia sp. RSA 2702]|nr:Elongation factor Ts, mitochondrial [Coemansia sp. RSA 2702]